MDADMRPEVVSELLSNVEAKWTQLAIDVLSNQASEQVAFSAMETSCKKVSEAVVQGSDGDRLKVIEYMKTVCSEPNAKANAAMCAAFANSIQQFMFGDNEYNRNRLDMSEFCDKYWSTSVKAVAKVKKQRLDEQEAQRLAEQKKREEEEAERRKKQADEDEKLAEEEAARLHHEAEEHRRLAEAVAKNNTALTVATRWNLAAKKKAGSTPRVTTSADESGRLLEHPADFISDASAASLSTESNIIAQNSTKSVKNGTGQNQTSVAAAAESNPKVQKDGVWGDHLQTLIDGFKAKHTNMTTNKNQTVNNTLEVQIKNSSAVAANQVQQSQALNNSLKMILENASGVAANPLENTSLAIHSTLKTMIKNISANIANQAHQKIESNLTAQVGKHLRFVMNHTQQYYKERE